MGVQPEKVVDIDRYSGIEINVYNDNVYLISVHTGSMEVNYRDYCFPEIYDKQKRKRRFLCEPDKPRPVQLKLGDRKAAIETLERVIMRIKGIG